jgi:hypothetical protein
MTTLADILATPLPSIDALRQTWLAFPALLAPMLEAAQSDQTLHRASPIVLSDGRLALCADLLTETKAGGLFFPAFSRLNPANFPAVEVLNDASFRALLIPFPKTTP